MRAAHLRVLVTRERLRVALKRMSTAGSAGTQVPGSAMGGGVVFTLLFGQPAGKYRIRVKAVKGHCVIDRLERQDDPKKKSLSLQVCR